MIVNYLAYYIPISVLAPTNINKALLWDIVHIYVTTLWHLASVISVLEPNGYGLTAMKKSKQLLRGRTSIAFRLASLYLPATWTIELVFELAMLFHIHFMVKLLVGLLCLFMFHRAIIITIKWLIRRFLYDHLGRINLDDISIALNPSTGGMEMQSLVNDHGKVGYQPVALNATTDNFKMQRSVKDHDSGRPECLK
ncbi:hypothetical protein MKX01_017482 [Papaver californicum]|nr:hypothetical protein MKX01_017482 [Papaver californicum]